MMKWLAAVLFLGTAPVLFGAEPWAEVTAPGADPVGTSRVEVNCRLLAHVDTGTLRAEMDGTDLTALITIAEGTAVIQMPGALPDGAHELVLSGQDKQGVPLPPIRRKFSVQVKQRREVSTSGTLSDQYSSTLRHEELPSQPDAQAGVAQGQVAYKAGAADHELSLTTIYNTPSPVPPSQNEFELSSATYSLKYEKETTKLSASAGQIVYDLSPLALASYSTRGGSFHLETRGLGLDVFSLDTLRPFGWRGNAGPGTNTDHRINGFRLQTRMLSTIELYGMYLNGTELQSSSYNIGTEAAPKSAEVAGLGGKFGDGRWSGLFEITQSKDAARPEDKPRAYRLQVATQRNAFGFQFSYQRVGEGYSSPGVPYISKDREDAMANVQFSKGTTAAGFSLGYQHDNLSGQGPFPALRQWRGGLTVNQGLGSAWSLSFSYNGAQQASDAVGAFPSQDLLTQSASAGISFRSRGHFLQYGLNGSLLDDDGPYNNDNRMVGHQLMYSVSAASWLDVSSSVQYNLVRASLQADYGRQANANLDLRTHFLNNTLNVDFGGSWNRAKADDHADASEMSAYHMRFGYRPLEKVRGFSQSNVALDLRQARTAFAGQTKTTLQVLLSATLNLSGRYAHAK